MPTLVKLYHWSKVREYITERLASLHEQIEKAPSDREVHILIGHAKGLREALNLEHTLTLLEESGDSSEEKGR